MLPPLHPRTQNKQENSSYPGIIPKTPNTSDGGGPSKEVDFLDFIATGYWMWDSNASPTHTQSQPHHHPPTYTQKSKKTVLIQTSSRHPMSVTEGDPPGSRLSWFPSPLNTECEIQTTLQHTHTHTPTPPHPTHTPHTHTLPTNLPHTHTPPHTPTPLNWV